MQNRFFTIIILILVIVFLGYWIFSGENTSDHSERAVDDSIAEKKIIRPAHEYDADIAIPKLKEILITNDKKTAIFVDPASKKTGSFHINDPVAEFIISDIQHNKVILLRGNEEIEVGLKDQKDIPGMEFERASKKTVQPDGYNKDEDSAPLEGSFDRHPATVGSLNN